MIKVVENGLGNFWRTKRLREIAASCAALGLGIFPSTAQSDSVASLVSQAQALGARTGIAVRDLHEAKCLLSLGQGSFIPASNQKIHTAIAVLAALGQSAQFRTEFRVRQGVLEVVAGGDPNWQTGTTYDTSKLFDRVGQALLAAQIPQLRGISLCTETFTGPIRPPDWPADQLENDYCAPTAGLVLEAGCFRAQIVPAPGQAKVTLLAPLMDLEITGKILCVDKKDAIYGMRDLGDRLHAQGAIYRGARPVELVATVRDPLLTYEQALRHMLRRHEIRIDPNAPSVNRDLLTIETPLMPALERLLQDSSNFDAEQLLRVLGARQLQDGSLAGGLRALQQVLTELGGPIPNGVVFADGSGLSRGNRTTPEYLTQVLATALTQVWRGALLDALPRAGAEGTLTDRFVGLPIAERVFAKTGWIRGASALTGVLRRTDGGLRVFAILMNYDPNLPNRNKRLKLLQEQMVIAIEALPKAQ